MRERQHVVGKNLFRRDLINLWKELEAPGCREFIGKLKPRRMRLVSESGLKTQAYLQVFAGFKRILSGNM